MILWYEWTMNDYVLPLNPDCILLILVSITFLKWDLSGKCPPKQLLLSIHSFCTNICWLLHSCYLFLSKPKIEKRIQLKSASFTVLGFWVAWPWLSWISNKKREANFSTSQQQTIIIIIIEASFNPHMM